MLPDIDNGYNEDTDYQLTTSNINLTLPACFRKCLQCGEENSNPYYQFCFICFRVSNIFMELIFYFIYINLKLKSSLVFN